MKASGAASYAVAGAPAVGPAIVTIFGIDVPVLALSLSIGALMLARQIAPPPPPLRKLTRQQQWALTALLVIFLFLAVTGNLPMVGNGEPLGVGMAVVWGMGLGFSGLTIIEIVSGRVVAMVRAMFGEPPK